MWTQRAVQPARCDSMLFQAHHFAHGMRLAQISMGAFRFKILLPNER